MAFLLLYWTGMRIGELLALTYNDIDLEKRTISINKSYQRLDGRDIITPPQDSKKQTYRDDTAVSCRRITALYVLIYTVLWRMRECSDLQNLIWNMKLSEGLRLPV